MNKIYKVIWSKVKNCYIVASELAKSHTKSPNSGIVGYASLASLESQVNMDLSRDFVAGVFPMVNRPVAKLSDFKITVAAIVKNEVENVPTWVKAARSCADEIVVVDTGSTDGTVERFADYGIKCFHYDWNDDFASAKNYMISLCHGDWIVLLDGDEWFREGCDVRKAIAKHHNNPITKAIIADWICLDKDRNNTIMFSGGAVRAFRNQPDVRYFRKVHENLTINYENFVFEPDFKMYHTGYSGSVNRSKHERNLRIMRTMFDFDNGKVEFPTDWRYIEDTYAGLGQFDKALWAADKMISYGVQDYSAAAWITKFNVLFVMKTPMEEMKKQFEYCFQTVPSVSGFRFLASIYYFRNGQIEAGLDNYIEGLRMLMEPQDRVAMEHTYWRMYLPEASALASTVYLKNNQIEAALYVCKVSEQYCGKSLWTDGALRDVHHVLGDIEHISFDKVKDTLLSSLSIAKRSALAGALLSSIIIPALGVANDVYASNCIIAGECNQVNDGTESVVVSGKCNVSCGWYSVIVSGCCNTARAMWTAILGGQENYVCADYATISGGRANYAKGMYSSIQGGKDNSASGLYSSISGGYFNSVCGDYSWAAGGSQGKAYAQYSSSIGGGITGVSTCATTAQYSVAIGKCATTTKDYEVAIGSSCAPVKIGGNVTVTGSNTVTDGSTSKTWSQILAGGSYTLPAATSSALGGVKVGSNITNNSGTISLTKANVTSALGYTPPTSDTNTHYTTHLYAGSGTAANAATTNGNTKIALADDSTVRNTLTIKGTGKTTVTSDANGVITINSTDANTTYSAFTGASSSAAGSAGLVKAPAAGDQNKFLRGDGTWAVDNDTHWTSHIYAGSGTAANAATTNGNTKIALADNSTVRNTLTIKGAGSTSVTSDANGVITINSTDNNTTYSAMSADELTTGTATTSRTMTAKVVSDYVKGKTDDKITGLSVSGTTITYTKGDGTTGTITTQDNNTTYTNMSASELSTGSSTTARSISAKVLNDFVDDKLGTVKNKFMAVNEDSMTDSDVSEASGDYSIALGKGAKATNTNTIAIGTGNVVTGQNSGAIGDPNIVDANNSYTVGNNSTISANVDGAFVLGNNVSVNNGDLPDNWNSLTDAEKSDLTGEGAIALGNNVSVSLCNKVNSSRSSDSVGSPKIQHVVAVGDSAIIGEENGVAIGYQAEARALNALATGTCAKALSEGATALGQGTVVHENSSFATAVGYETEATGEGASAFGDNAIAGGKFATAFGRATNAQCEASTAIGNEAVTTGKRAVAIGNESVAGAEGATSIGNSSNAVTRNAVSIGNQAVANGEGVGVVAIGNCAQVGTADSAKGSSTAVGAFANVQSTYSTALGAQTSVTANNSVALGAGSVASQTNVVSVGAGTASDPYPATRKIINVTAGASCTDAATVGQTIELENGINSVVTADGINSIGQAKYKIDVAGNGTVASGNTGLISGGTLFTEGRIASNGNYVQANNSIAQNLSALDTQVKANADAIDVNRTKYYGVNAQFEEWTDSNAEGLKTKYNVETQEEYENLVVNGFNIHGEGATGENAIAIGKQASASSYDSIALGTNASASTDGIAIGLNSSTELSSGIAIGLEASSKGGASISLGDHSASTGPDSIAMGNDANAIGNQSVSIGFASQTTNLDDIAIGYLAKTEGTGYSNIAIGRWSNVANGEYNIAIGDNSLASGDYEAIAIGKSAKATAAISSAFGFNSVASGEHSSAIGSQALASCSGSVAIGFCSVSSGSNALSIGSFSNAICQYSTVIGYNSKSAGLRSTGIGYNVNVGGTDNVAIGSTTFVSGSNSIALGSNSVALESNVLSLGKDAVGTIGQSDYVAEVTRKIQHVTAGTADTDAVNVKQLTDAIDNHKIEYVGLNTVWKDWADLTDAEKTAYGITTEAEYDTVVAGSNRNGEGAVANDTIAIGKNAKAGKFETANSTYYGVNSIAIGTNSSSPADEAISIGGNALALNAESIAIGSNSHSEYKGVAIGSCATNKSWSVAVGGGAYAVVQSTAVGIDANAGSSNATSIGYKSKSVSEATALGAFAEATGYTSTAVGKFASSSGSSSLALGEKASASCTWATAIGIDSKAQGTSSIALGQSSIATNSGSVAIGLQSNVSGNYAVGIGLSANASCADAVSIGTSAITSAERTVAIGSSAKSLKQLGVSMGSSAQSNGQYAISIGSSSAACADYAVALGGQATVNGENSLALGHLSTANGSCSTIIGYNVYSNYNNTTAVGNSISANCSYATVLGSYSNAYGEKSVAIGYNAYANTSSSIAIGNNINITCNDAVGIGHNTYANAERSVALGSGSQTLEADSISIGKQAIGTVGEDGYTPEYTRRIMHVTAGVNDTDAVNVEQLNAATASLNGTLGNAIMYDAADKNLATMAGTSGTKLTNLKAATLSTTSTDAVTGSQLYAVKQDIAGFAEDIQKNSDNIRSLNSSVTSALSSVAASGLLVDTMDASKADASLNNLTDSGKRVLKQYAENAVQEYMAAQQGSNSAPMAPMMYAGNSNILSVTDAGNGSLHVGEGSYVNGTSSIAIGVGNQVNANNSGAFGDPSIINADESYVLGNDDTINTGATGSFIVGNNGVSDAKGGLLFGSNTKATAEAENGMALGNKAEVSAKNAIALGSGSIADTENTLSIGNSNLKRKIVNVADGSITNGSNEAVTGGQLFITNEKVQKNTEALECKAEVDASNINTVDWANKLGIGEVKDGDSNLVTGGTVFTAIQDIKAETGLIKETESAIMIGQNSSVSKIDVSNASGNARVITGIVVDESDMSSAANVGYVNQVGANIAQAATQAIQKVDTKVNKVGANAAAIANLPTPVFDGDEKWAFSAGVGHYQGETAGAVGAFYRPSDNVIVRASGSFGNGDEMVGAGVSVSLNKANTPVVSKAQLVRTINAQAGEIQGLKAEQMVDKAKIEAVSNENQELKAVLMNMQERLAKLENK